MIVLGNMHLVTPGVSWPEAWLRIEGPRVVAATPGRCPGRPDFDLEGRKVLPGFVDLHCHGGGGASFASADADEVSAAAAFHLSRGTTTVVASLVSDAIEVLVEQLRVLSECTRAGIIAGVHLEGPFLSPLHHGAHEPSVMRDPTPEALELLVQAAGGALRIVTIAPERRGAPDAIRWLVERGIVAAVGHTDATYEQTQAALAAGARLATHLGNAMRATHHRAAGPMLALLADHRVVCELIADGRHLARGFVEAVMKLAGPGRVALVSDAVPAAGMPDGDYRFGPVDVVLAGGQATTISGALAGSTVALDGAFRRVTDEHEVSLSSAVRMASTTPASLLGNVGVGDVGQETAAVLHPGDLAPGSPADLVVVDDRRVVGGVMRRGTWVLT